MYLRKYVSRVVGIIVAFVGLIFAILNFSLLLVIGIIAIPIVLISDLIDNIRRFICGRNC